MLEEELCFNENIGHLQVGCRPQKEQNLQNNLQFVQIKNVSSSNRATRILTGLPYDNRMDERLRP